MAKTAARPDSTDVRVLANRRAARLTIREAASSGSRRDLLAAMRDMVAGELDAGVPARELASCTRRLLEIAKEIEAIDSLSGGDEVGDAASTPDEEWSVT